MLLQAYVPPPEAVKLAASPAQIVTVDGLILAVGIAFTVTVEDAVAEQIPAVTVTVYVVVPDGVKVAAAVLPPLLLHAYVPFPLAVNVCEAPAQMLAVLGVIFATGTVFTVK
jgi:hypothetical protein